MTKNPSKNDKFASESTYSLGRSPYSSVSNGALSYNPTERVISLSQHKVRKENHLRSEFSRDEYDPANSGVYNKAALKAVASDRIEELSKPKLKYAGYQFARPVESQVSEGAKKVVASERLTTLSQPRSH